MTSQRIPVVALAALILPARLVPVTPRAQAGRPRRAAVPNGSEPTAPPRVAKPRALTRALARVFRARRLRKARAVMVVVDLATERPSTSATRTGSSTARR